MTEAAGAHQSTVAGSPASGGADGLGLAVKLLVGLVLAIAILFRIYELGRLPGVNGDEAWYGVQAHQWLSGEAPAWRTPNGNVPGPLHMALVLGLESLFPPSFALLRIPAVISSLAAMLLARLSTVLLAALGVALMVRGKPVQERRAPVSPETPTAGRIGPTTTASRTSTR